MFSCFYNSLLLGMLISVVLFQNTWLEMRVNLGHVFFALAAVLFVLQVLAKPVRKICGTFRASTLSLMISGLSLWLMLGSEGMKIIPASIIREGIMQNHISFSIINTVIIAGVIIGWWLTYMLNRP